MSSSGVVRGQSLRTDGRTSMRRNGKSFWFASLFLPRTTAADAGELYGFCRTMDDLADERGDPEAVMRLNTVRLDLQHGSSNDLCVQSLLELAKRYRLDLRIADYLVQSFVEDAGTKLQLETEADLIRYCFGVAGTVGLMMSSILGADPILARQHAIDLGIAMQMTNIARDVLEDARNGRRYLPGRWVEDRSPATIAASDAHSGESVRAAILRLLALADRFYASAAYGFRFIPVRSRLAIGIAAAVYREIGVSLREGGVQWQGARTVVPSSRKTVLAARVLVGASPLRRLPFALAFDEIHEPLVGLPGAA